MTYGGGKGAPVLIYRLLMYKSESPRLTNFWHSPIQTVNSNKLKCSSSLFSDKPINSNFLCEPKEATRTMMIPLRSQTARGSLAFRNKRERGLLQRSFSSRWWGMKRPPCHALLTPSLAKWMFDNNLYR